MSPFLSKELLQKVFHSGCAFFQRTTVTEFLLKGVDPCWCDHNGVSCIDNALTNLNGKYVDTSTYKTKYKSIFASALNVLLKFRCAT